MKTFNDLIPLRLYSSANKMYIPINKENKNKNSCMVILGNSDKSVNNTISSPIIVNNNRYKAYYTEKGINKLINARSTIPNNTSVTENTKQDAEIMQIDESLIHKKPKIKFRYMNGSTTVMKEISKYINEESVYEINRALNNSVLLDGATFNIYIHNKPISILNDSESSYIYDIHVVSPMGFDEDKEGKYEYYLKHELALSMITSINPDVNKILAIQTAVAITGQLDAVKDINYIDLNAAKLIDAIYKDKGPSKIVDIIKNNDVSYLAKYAANHSIIPDIVSSILFDENNIDYLNTNQNILYESKLTTEERNKLPDSEFGIPSDRKYPLNDSHHTKSAIKFFNYVDKEHEEELAKNIIKKMKKYGINNDEVGDNNRLKKYL